MKITEKPFSIPDHWRWIELKELAEVNPTFDRDDLSDNDPVSFVGMKRVEELSGRIDLSETQPLSEVRKGYTYFEDGDVLFAKITPCMENGKVAVARGLENGVGFGSTEFHVIRHPEETTQEWIFHYLIQEGFRRDAKRAMTGSAGQKRVPTGYIEEVPIPLPPLPEQRRIVAKIEELFSNLDAGMDDLQAAGQQLERYRLSVLQAAVEGRLTADWRRTHDPEPADQLLERILEERRKKWEEDYRAKYEKKGKELPEYWKSRYSPPDEPDLPDDLHEVPESWTWTSLGYVCDMTSGGTPKRSNDSYWGGDIPWLKSGELNDGLVTEAEERITEKGLEESSTNIFPSGTLLVALYGATTGKLGILNFSTATNQAICGLFVTESLNTKYLFWYLRHFRPELLSKRFGGAQKNISQTILKQVSVPLPPLAEQKQIVDEIERLLSVADDAAATAEREQTRAERLRQSILKQAFTGRLVSHDEDATSPAIEASSSNRKGQDASGDTDASASEDSSDRDDVMAEELYNSGDPGKQIEMDL